MIADFQLSIGDRVMGDWQLSATGNQESKIKNQKS